MYKCKSHNRTQSYYGSCPIMAFALDKWYNNNEYKLIVFNNKVYQG